ncbi:MAG: hypothetical protein OEM41_00605 [Ignavibacteria bacterium]|nr:hypothetical protein [Ignavibacteria bacterium]
MNKKIWIGFVVVFVVISILEFIVNSVLLKGAYESTANLWRPVAEMKIWLFYVVYAFQAFFLTLIFSKGYEGKGVAEGARFGLYVGLLFAIPMAYGSYAAMPITYSLALQWFLYGLAEFVIVGIVLALVFGKQAVVQKVMAS